MTEGITQAQRDALVQMAPALEDSTYLAGGVAVATALHHRLSLDLDLFVTHDFDPERLAERLSPRAPTLRIVGRAAGTLHAEVLGVPVSVLSYRYPLLAPHRNEVGLAVPLASLEDLACMKVSAVAGRGAAKDFWDLHALLACGVAGGDLAQALQLYRRKFPVEDIGHAIKSLAYFGDADSAPLPRGLSPERWQSLKADFAGWVRSL